MKKGKLIVIDGIDGSGKGTQTELLVKALRAEKIKVKVISFPEYSGNFFGGFIGHCLKEQYFNFVKVHPKIASVLFAADRFEAKDKIEKWLRQGFIVIADRYVSANQIHQGGKITNIKKRQEFIEWLDEMEYKVFKIPKPNIVFYLDLPLKVALKLIKERDLIKKRNYLGHKKDVHEKDVNFLKNSYKAAQWLSKNQKNWITIDCVKNGMIDSRENIHKKIYYAIIKIKK
jgi:dTMP kinase